MSIAKIAGLIRAGRGVYREAKWSAMVFRLLADDLSADEVREFDELSHALGRESSDEIRARQPKNVDEVLRRLSGE